MIEVRDLRKIYPTRFGENLVLDGINFDLNMGERLGILGHNGAGKSTLVRLISGAELPTSGSVSSTLSISWPIAFGGAFQFNLTGVDNVRFISRIYDQDAERNLAFVEEFAELGPYLREEVRFYSSGMRARLAFAISMIIEFDCFLIDEVGAVGDARFHERCEYELFHKRADRAMVIISHDATYIRDKCNRFGVLHDAKLELFDDFDRAYADFRRKLGLDAAARSPMDQLAEDRTQLIETTHTISMLDDSFRASVQQADWKRDAGEWAAAEEEYSHALKIFPFQRSYWVQKGHVAKEAGDLALAEASYRSAIALGEPQDDVRPHLDFVIARQGDEPDDYPAAMYRPCQTAEAAPALPDLELFARVAWREDVVEDARALALLRANQSCDALLGEMMRDPRFDTARRQGEVDVRKGEDRGDVPRWLADLVVLACPQLESGAKKALIRRIAKILAQGGDPWPALISAGGYQGWQALEQLRADAA